MLELAVLLLLFVIPSFILCSCCGAKKSKTSSDQSKIEGKDMKASSQAESLLERLRIDKKTAVITLCLEKSMFESPVTSSPYQDLSRLLETLSTNCSIYLIIPIANVNDQQLLQNRLLEEVPNFLNKNPQRLLFCSTEIGKVAFVRQIKPHLHIEYDPASYESLRPHVPINIIQQLAIPRFEDAYGKRLYPNVIRNIADLQTLVVKV